MSDQYIDITPAVHFLESIRADRGSWPSLLAEGVDNSLDAGATEIAIKLLADSVVIADNGCGISKDRESAIVRLGEHAAMPNTKLGRFGMGIKYNATSAGDLLEVESYSVDGHMVLAVDWPKVIRSGRWEIPRPKWTPMLIDRGSGTTIKIGRLRWEAPRDRDVATARDHLAQIFYPAIEHGAIIRLNGIPLRLLKEPNLTDVVEQSIQLPNGKGAHVRGGMLVHPDTATLRQVQVSYKHRVILAKGAFGCGSYSGLRQMFARVTLTADWGLTRFKDGLNDPDAAQLEDAVQDVLKPILERCHSAHMDLKVEEMTERLNELLPVEMRAARPPRKRPRSERAARKKEPGPQHGSTSKEPAATGPARIPRTPIGNLLITFEGSLCEEHGYGHFIKGRPNRITLATDNPDIAGLLEQRDTHLCLRSLYVFALMIYERAKETELGQTTLPFEGSFGLRVWKTAAQQTATNDELATGSPETAG